ncbi:MAG: sigma-70 family RNA polymerase sigma factor [Planctomycetota bacterium]
MPRPDSEPNPALQHDALLEQVQWVRGLALSLVRDSNDADDLSQEALLAAVDSPPEGNLRAWFSRVLRYKRSTQRRTTSRRARRERESAVGESLPSTSDVLERAELHRKLVETAFRLREPFRTTVLLRYFEGLDPDQIARQQGIAVATVRSRLKRGLDELREQLDHDFGDRRTWCLAILPLTLLPTWSVGHAAAATVSSATSSSVAIPATLVGGVIMSIKTVVAAAAAIGVVAGAMWFLQSSSDPPAPVGLTAERTTNSSPNHLDTSATTDEVPAATDSPAATVRAQESDSAAPRSVTDPATGTIRVQVVDVDGRALEQVVIHALRSSSADPVGDRVGALLLGPPVQLPPVDDPTNRGVTDAAGACELVGLTVGSYRLAARAEGFCTEVVNPVMVESAQPTELKVLLTEGLTIEGTVVDPSGFPVVGVEVTARTGFFVSSGDDNLAYTVQIGAGGAQLIDPSVTDDRGRFRLTGLTARNYTLRAAHTDWVQAASREVAAGSRGVILEMARGAELSGVVIAPDGGPVAGAMVRVRSADPLTRIDPATTDAMGRFHFLGLPSGTLDLVTHAQGYAPQTTRGLKAKVGESTATEIVLERGAVVFGRIVDPDDEPVAGASVIFDGKSGDRSFVAPTNEDGSFRFENLAATERYEAKVRHPDYRHAVIASFDAHGEIDLGTTRLSRGAVISGRVVDADSNPVAGTRVSLRSSTEDRQFEAIFVELGDIQVSSEIPGSITTDADGNFRIAGVEAGDYRLSARANGFASYRGETLSVEGDTVIGGVTIVLERGLAITGTVVDPTGNPVPGASVAATTSQPLGGRTETTTLADGTFELTGLSEPTYNLTAKSPAFGSVSIRGVASGQSAVTLEFRARASLTGTVVSATTQQPVEEFEVLLRPVHTEIADFDINAILAQSMVMPQRFKDPGGVFHRTGLEPGAYTLVVRAQSHAPSQQEIVLAEGVHSMVEILIEQGGVISGRVVDPDGKPIRGATVRVAREDAPPSGGARIAVSMSFGDGGSETSTSFDMGQGERVKTDTDGRFTYEGLAPGKTQLVIAHAQFISATTEVVEVLRDGKHDLQTVELRRGGTIRGTVYDADGRPTWRVGILFFAVDEQGQRGEPRFTRPKADGSFSQSGLEDGLYQLELNPWEESGSTSVRMNAEQPTLEVRVREGQTVERDLHLQRPQGS